MLFKQELAVLISPTTYICFLDTLAAKLDRSHPRKTITEHSDDCFKPDNIYDGKCHGATCHLQILFPVKKRLAETVINSSESFWEGISKAAKNLRDVCPVQNSQINVT